MRDWKLWAIVILTGVIILLILFQPKRQPNLDKIKALEYGIAHADIKIVQLTKDSTKLAEKIKADSIRQANEKISYQTTIKKQVAVIAKLRVNPIVVKVREETPEVDSLLDAMEVKDSTQTVRITVLERDNHELRVDLQAVKDNFSQTLQLEREKFLAQAELTKEYKSQLRKEKRKVKLVKVVAVIGSVGAFILGSQL